jgi:hypothetical protein
MVDAVDLLVSAFRQALTLDQGAELLQQQDTAVLVRVLQALRRESSVLRDRGDGSTLARLPKKR